ncbi:hypothetical protein D3C80_1339740 [compost metagenome]
MFAIAGLSEPGYNICSLSFKRQVFQHFNLIIEIVSVFWLVQRSLGKCIALSVDQRTGKAATQGRRTRSGIITYCSTVAVKFHTGFKRYIVYNVVATIGRRPATIPAVGFKERFQLVPLLLVIEVKSCLALFRAQRPITVKGSGKLIGILKEWSHSRFFNIRKING